MVQFLLDAGHMQSERKKNMVHEMWYLTHCRAMKAQVSLCKSAGTPEHSVHCW